MTELKLKKIKYRYEGAELLNIRANVLYLIAMGILIFMFN
jgi:hypothetical protein